MNDSLEQILSAKKINPTAMRLLVLEYLVKQITAVSLQDVERDFHHADRITLYRTLKTFEAKGLIHTIQDGTGAAKYALCTEACSDDEHYDLHLHFNCTRCGETYCLPKVNIPEVSLPNRFVLEELNLTAKGICDRCNRN
jgi:Fur family transcriptional regulator, ferric uptake regulator